MDFDIAGAVIEVVFELLLSGISMPGEKRQGKSTEPTVPLTEHEKVIGAESMNSYFQILRKLEVEVLMLSYIFQQDDGMITKDESRLLKKHIHPYIITLREADLDRLYKMAKQTIAIGDISSLIAKIGISEEELNQVFTLLHNVNRITKRHGQVIEFLRTQLIFN